MIDSGNRVNGILRKPLALGVVAKLGKVEV